MSSTVVTYPGDGAWPPVARHSRLIDEIYEAVGEAVSPAARAAVMSLLVEEMCAAVEAVHPSVVGPELMGLTRLSVAAADHAVRMAEDPSLLLPAA